MTKIKFNYILITLTVFFVACTPNSSKDILLKRYLNQPDPGTKAVLFAPDFFSSQSNVRDVAFTPDGKEFYFTQIIDDAFTIMVSLYQSGQWTAPAVASFSGKYNDFEPSISPDGNTFFFASMRPSNVKREMKDDIDIWKMDKTARGWNEPEPLSETINTNQMEYFPSTTNDGTLYFGRNDLQLTRGDIYYSRFDGRRYATPVKLPDVVNLTTTSFNAFIAADESYLIFSTYVPDDSLWHSDLFISFRDSIANWSLPQNMGPRINSKGNDHAPWVSYDGKNMFFASTRADTSGQNKIHRIYWLDAVIIEELYSSQK